MQHVMRSDLTSLQPLKAVDSSDILTFHWWTQKPVNFSAFYLFNCVIEENISLLNHCGMVILGIDSLKAL